MFAVSVRSQGRFTIRRLRTRANPGRKLGGLAVSGNQNTTEHYWPPRFKRPDSGDVPIVRKKGEARYVAMPEVQS